MTTSRWFHKFDGKRDAQVNFTRYWAGLGLKSWPKYVSGGQKRAFHFGFGYFSWRLPR